jgi:nitrogen regulatory protein PII-like uncharacterized protein
MRRRFSALDITCNFITWYRGYRPTTWTALSLGNDFVREGNSERRITQTSISNVAFETMNLTAVD